MTREPDSRAFLAALYRAAIRGADPAAGVRRALAGRRAAERFRRARRLGIFAAGKASAAMFAGTRGTAFDRALVVMPRGYEGTPPPRGEKVEILFASHPEPDGSSVAAARRALAFFSEFSADDVILCLISGGASSLLCLPAKGLTLARKRARIRDLARSGAGIEELNRLRARLSRVKGGRLGTATEAPLVTLVLSDVPGDRPETVGSGPTIRRDPRDVVRVVGSNRSGLDAAARLARGRGFRVVRAAGRFSGDAAAVGSRIGRKTASLPARSVYLAGGETTVRLGRRAGIGGRSLELALAAARPLAGSKAALLAAGSDGRDGASRGAGAFVDGFTLSRALDRGLSPEDALRRHDTEAFFEAIGGLFAPGATGTNVADWVFVARR